MNNKTSILNFYEELTALNSCFELEEYFVRGKKKVAATECLDFDKAAEIAVKLTTSDLFAAIIDNFLATHENIYAMGELKAVYEEGLKTGRSFRDEMAVQLALLLTEGKFILQHGFSARINNDPVYRDAICRGTLTKWVQYNLLGVFQEVLVETGRDMFSNLTVANLRDYVWWRKNLPIDVEIRDYSNAEIIGLIDIDELKSHLNIKTNTMQAILKSANTELNRVRKTFDMERESLYVVSNTADVSSSIFDELPDVDVNSVFECLNQMEQKMQKAAIMKGNGYSDSAIGREIDCSDKTAKKLYTKAFDLLRKAGTMK